MNDERELIDAYLDGDLTADEEGRLAAWLAADTDRVRQFVRETHLHRQLREAMLARQFQSATFTAQDPALGVPASAGPAVRDRGTEGIPLTPSEGARVPEGRVRGKSDGSGSFLASGFFFLSLALRRFWLPLAACLALVAVGLWYFGPTMGEPVLTEV
ncbi:MAG: hypothetical protein DME26_17850, partial [Verrucomicrobia bacterium]